MIVEASRWYKSSQVVNIYEDISLRETTTFIKRWWVTDDNTRSGKKMFVLRLRSKFMGKTYLTDERLPIGIRYDGDVVSLIKYPSELLTRD